MQCKFGCDYLTGWLAGRLTGWLTEWLAGKVDLQYVHIDPLKVDFSKIADLMSTPYAERFHILPLEVRGSEVVIATSEPFLVEWIPEMERVLRRNIRRVLANPVIAEV